MKVAATAALYKFSHVSEATLLPGQSHLHAGWQADAARVIFCCFSSVQDSCQSLQACMRQI